MDIEVNGSVFKFNLKPYFLRCVKHPYYSLYSSLCPFLLSFYQHVILSKGYPLINVFDTDLYRLTFPGNIVEDERSKASYDVGAGELTVVLAKETPGEHFPDLDMLTKLLVRTSDPSEKQARKPLIEVISSGETLEGTQKLDKDEEFDWEMPQEIKQEVYHDPFLSLHHPYLHTFALYG